MAPKYVPADVEVRQPEDTALDAGGFVGVDPIYQNFANDTDAPYSGETKSKVTKGESQAVVVPAPEESDEDSEEDKKDDGKKPEDTTPKAPAAPATPAKSGTTK